MFCSRLQFTMVGWHSRTETTAMAVRKWRGGTEGRQTLQKHTPCDLLLLARPQLQKLPPLPPNSTTHWGPKCSRYNSTFSIMLKREKSPIRLKRHSFLCPVSPQGGGWKSPNSFPPSSNLPHCEHFLDMGTYGTRFLGSDFT